MQLFRLAGSYADVRPADTVARFHTGQAEAATAEQLMRSRYSAFALLNTEYLLKTWHRDTAPAGLDTSSWFESRVPRAADQPESRIELSSITDTGPAVPTPPPLSQVTADVRDSGPAADPAVREQFSANGDGQLPSS